MIEANNKVVSLSYTLFRDSAEGELIESTEGKEPLVFLSGVGMMIPEFEQNVVGLAVGEEFSFGIKAANAYGEREDDAIIELAKDIFKDQTGKPIVLELGKVIPLQDNNGHVHQARVLAIGDEKLTMDINHPLAGQDLYFKGSILEVREATPEEIAHAQESSSGQQH